jgi:hypothetical protein
MLDACPLHQLLDRRHHLAGEVPARLPGIRDLIWNNPSILVRYVFYRVHKLAEEGRIAVRHVRTETMSKIKKLEKVSEDDKTRAEKDVQKLTDEHIKQIDGLIHSKEAEIMEV